MTQLFSNAGSSTLLSGIGTTDTQLTVQAGDGEKFPAIGVVGDYFVGVLEDVNGNIEIVTCTARTGDTITIIRAGEGTPATAFLADDRFELRVTKETLEEFIQRSGDIFTGPITVPGIDLVTEDQSAHNPITWRYNEINGVPTMVMAGPESEAVALLWETYRSAGYTWSYGLEEDGTNVTPGKERIAWYGADPATDPEWNITRTNAKPDSESMRLEWRPNAEAINVSYLFEVVDEHGVRREIIINTDGSITSGGDMTLASLTLSLQNFPELEAININFSVVDIYAYGPQRVVSFAEENFGGDAGEPGTGTAYQFHIRDDEGNARDIWFTPDGSIWTSGFAVHTKVLVGDQGLPETLAPNELITKNYFEVHGGGGVATSNYFSEVLFDGVMSNDNDTEVLLHPLYTTIGDITHFEQVQVETWFDSPWLTAGYSIMTIDVATLRLNSDYIEGPGQFHGDNDSGGTVLFRFTDYETIKLTNTEFNGQIRRVIGISYKGNPFPDP